MKNKLRLSSILFIVLFLASCGQQGGDDLEAKKEQLKALKKQKGELNSQIFELENTIREEDPDYFQKGVGKYVSVLPVEKTKFKHFFEVQGTAESENSIAVSTDMGGLVQKIYVSEGDRVKEGQLLIQLDNSVVLKNIEELKTSLNLAETLYEKQKRLWEKNIGSEVEYLQSKNNKEQLETKLASARAQLDKTQIKAPFNGTVDKVFVKVGEMASPGRPAVRVMNLELIKVEADVSENYLGTVEEGDSVLIDFPVINLERYGIVKSVGQFIDPANRSFGLYIQVPNTDRKIKANLLAKVKINDYTKENALVIPTRLIQFSQDGDYIYVKDKNEEGQVVARKVFVEKGKTYKGKSVIKKGLKSSDKVIDEGHRDLANGDRIQIVE